MLSLGDMTARIRSTEIERDDWKMMVERAKDQHGQGSDEYNEMVQRYRQAARAHQNASRILRLKEKHGTWTYLIPTDDHLMEIALATVKRRLDEGYWYLDDLPEGDSHNQLGLFSGKVMKLSSKEKAQLIVDRNDGRAAWNFLQDRSDYHYEEIEIDHFEVSL